MADATALQRRGGSTLEHQNFTGLDKEITIDTDKHTVVVHDGVTQGGHPLATMGDIASLSDAVAGLAGASSQFGSNTQQTIPTLSSGFGPLDWDQVMVNSDDNIIEAQNHQVVFKRLGTYQFNSNLALEKIGSAGNVVIDFKLKLDGVEKMVASEAINLKADAITYMPVTTVLVVDEPSVLTVEMKLQNNSNVTIHHFSSTLVLTQVGQVISSRSIQTLAKKDVFSPCFTKTGASSISIKAGTYVQLNGQAVPFYAETPVIMPTLNAGNDYAIFVNPDGTAEAVEDPFESPAAKPTPESVQIGGFHFGEVGVAETVAGGQFATSGAGMIWTQDDVDMLQGINAYSIWDLRWRRAGMPNIAGSPRNGKPSNHGFALDPHTNKWIAIYYVNTDVDTYGLSRAGSDVASGTVVAKIPRAFGGNGTAIYTTRGGLTGPGNWWDLQEVLASQGARHPYEHEFNSFAFGTTGGKVLGGASSTIPMTKREAGYTSRIGIEQVSGHHWIWSMSTGSAASGSYVSNTGGRGQQNTSSNKAILGATRDNDAARCGSRTASWSHSGSYSAWRIGARASDDHLCL